MTASQNDSGYLSTLAELLHPLAQNTFFEEYWDTQVLHVPGSPGRFAPIVEPSDFCAALFEAYIGDKHIQFLRNSIGHPPKSNDAFWRQKAQWETELGLEELANEINQGTIIFDMIEKRVENLQRWCRGLFRDFGGPISANAYFSAGKDASAFDAHFDEQNVFVLQLEGEKEWRLWTNGRVENPSHGYPKTKPQKPSLPSDTTVLLKAGDVLYVPRGTWHWPRTLDDRPSLHLTVSVVMPEPADVLHWIKQQLYQDPEMRSSHLLEKGGRGDIVDSAKLNAAFEAIGAILNNPEREARAVSQMRLKGINSLRDQTKEPDKG